MDMWFFLPTVLLTLYWRHCFCINWTTRCGGQCWYAYIIRYGAIGWIEEGMIITFIAIIQCSFQWVRIIHYWHFIALLLLKIIEKVTHQRRSFHSLLILSARDISSIFFLHLNVSPLNIALNKGGIFLKRKREKYFAAPLA